MHAAIPTFRNRFFGRQAALGQLTRWLDAGGRQPIAVTGVSGVGKSRLIAELFRTWDSGARIRYVDLRPIESVRSARQRIDRTLEEDRKPECDLLVLDNADVLDLSENWVQSLADSTRLVVTHTGAASFGDAHVLLLSTLLSEGDQVALEFLEDRLSRMPVPLVREQGLSIVRTLDGLPRALELVAPQIALLGGTEFLKRLGSGEVTGHGVRALQESVRQARSGISEAAATLLCTLCTFVGDFCFDALRAVAPRELHPDLVDLVHELLVNGLLSPTPGGEPRWRLMSELRRQLRHEGYPHEAPRRAHADYFADEALRQGLRLRTPEIVTAMKWFETEEPNLTEVVRFTGTREDALTVATVLTIRESRMTYREQADLIRQALARDGEARAATELEARLQLASLDRRMGQVDLARATLEAIEQRATGLSLDSLMVRVRIEQSRLEIQNGDLQVALQTLTRLEGAESSNDADRALILRVKASTLASLGRTQESLEACEESRRLAERLGDIRTEAEMAAYIGNLALDLGNLDEALMHLAHAVSVLEQMDLSFGGGFAYAALGGLRHRQGKLDLAEENYIRAIEAFRALGALVQLGAFEGFIGVAYRERGNLDTARSWLFRGQKTLRTAGDRRYLAYLDSHLACVLVELGESESASLLLARCERDIGESGDPALMLAVAAQATAARGLLARKEGNGAEFDRARSELVSMQDRRDDRGRPLRATSTDLFLSLRCALAAVGLQEHRDAVGSSASIGLRLEAKGAWFELQKGESFLIANRPALGRVLSVLARKHLTSPGGLVSVQQLVDAGWPSEKLLHQSALNRVRVAIATLRKLGLSLIIETVDGGYRLAPSVIVTLAPEGSSIPQ